VGKGYRLRPWQKKIHEVIFEADTSSGKVFDIALLIAIVASIGVVLVDSVPSYHLKFNEEFVTAEWFFTIIFTIEYVLRLASIGRPMKYVLSFFGIIDLLSILPAYLGLFMDVGEYHLMLRTMRLLRVFRVLKLGRYLKESRSLVNAIKASRTKIFIFMFFILIVVLIMGTLMYVIEAPHNEMFTSIPRSIYWAIVTLTTVGYGDISPTTPLGQMLAGVIMIMGYAVIAVPTGIVSAEFVSQNKTKDAKSISSEELISQYNSTQTCQQCSAEGHDVDADFCKKCGAELNPVD